MSICVHCRRAVRGADYPIHDDGGYRGKQRCDPADTRRPYGLAAHRAGTPCHELCNGTITIADTRSVAELEGQES